MTGRTIIAGALLAGAIYGQNSGLESTFVPIYPCRLADTREAGMGTAFGTPSLPGGRVERSFPVPQSACGIPSHATAYALNVTAVPKGPLSFLTVWPTGQPQPFVSTLNSYDGRIKANAANIAAGVDGAVSVTATDATDVVLDISGYFTRTPPGLALPFGPIVPCRLLDTRNTQSPLSPHETRRIELWSSCGLPPFFRPNFPTAYSLNITAVPNGPLGYLSVWPSGLARPLISTLNSPTGTVVANAAIVMSDADQAINVFATNETHVVIDMNAHFGASPYPGRFQPITPCRAVDTRLAENGPILAAGTSRSFPLLSSACGLPSFVAAYALNVTVVPPAPLSYLTVWPTGHAQPFVSTLNAMDGAVVSNAAIVGAGTGYAISVFASHATHVILDVTGYFTYGTPNPD